MAKNKNEKEKGITRKYGKGKNWTASRNGGILMDSRPGGDNLTDGNRTGGNLTGGSKTYGNKTGGNLTGGNRTGGNRTGGNKTGGDMTGGNRTSGNVPVQQEETDPFISGSVWQFTL
ncbi:hypothetical protein [Paenibacillus harenae]|uniref:hypothetical protein n=1 Tax=Paenibacillus harenae TaxID=306543 RepID=UPI00042466FF|nr:hypothetical protein [Paenibacillus harenae]